MAGRAESGTQFEAPGSRPTSAEGKILVPKKFIPARSKSTEPRLTVEVAEASLSKSLKSSDLRKGGVPTANTDGENNGSKGPKFPSLNSAQKISSDPSPFLLPLQRVYSPSLLINHVKNTKSSVRIAPVDDGGVPRTRMPHSTANSVDESFRGRRSTSHSLQASSIQPTSANNSLLSVTAGPMASPSVFGTKSATTPTSRGGLSKSLSLPKRESFARKERNEQSKPSKMNVEEIDVFLPSAKELKEVSDPVVFAASDIASQAKELFRQFDTDGDGMLTMAEIQASLYFNNVDFEEIQAIFGPSGIKLSQNGNISVEEFATYLCRRRRENANRQQNSHISKHSKVIRVYVSSCMHQHFSERKVLHEVVFPRLMALAESVGAEIFPIDLRYNPGGSEEASQAGPSQIEAMNELSKVATDKNYIFLGLIADLPGECVLPSELSHSEFETLIASSKIIEAASDEKGLSDAIERLYVLDKNAVVPTYVLQPGSEEEIAMILRAFAEQEGEDKQLHSSFARVRAKISKSLNEQELTKCISLGSELDQAKRTYIFIRNVDSMALDKYHSIMPNKTDDETLQIIERQTNYKENVIERFHEDQVFQHRFTYNSNLLKLHNVSTKSQKAAFEILDQEYLNSFGNQVYECLSSQMIQMMRQPSAPMIDMELEAHVDLLKRNAANIFRWESHQLAHDIMDYIRGSPSRATILHRASNLTDAKSKRKAKEEADRQAVPNCPLVITGMTGAGKSSLLAACAEKFSYSKEAGHCVLIYRCIGATPFTRDGRLLLETLCEELARVLGQERAGPRPASYNTLLVEFPELLRVLSNKKPVIIFLDGLNDLPRTDHARRLSWLPATLPNNVYVVASALEDDPKAISKYLKQNVRPLQALDPGEHAEMIEHWLDNYKQGLQPEQKAAVLENAKSMATEASASRSYLRFCFDEATNFVSSFAFPDRLLDITTTPGVLVYECLGLLCVARNGLSEYEILQLLFLEEGGKHSKSFPYRMFNRMMHRLLPYIATRERDYRTVFSIRHESYRSIILNVPGFQERVSEWNRMLAKFYAGQKIEHESEILGRRKNVRKLRNMIYHQINAELWHDVCVSLCNLELVQAMCEAGMSAELQRMYTTAMQAVPPDLEGSSEDGGEASYSNLQTCYRFFIRCINALGQHSSMIEQPGLLIQMAANEPEHTLPEIQASKILSSTSNSRVWMQALNKPISISPLTSVLIGSRSVVRCSHISDDGSVIVNGSDSGDIYIWDSETSESVMSFQAHRSVVNAVMFLSSSRILTAASDNTAKIWDESTTACIATYKGHSSPVLCLAVSPDGKTFASGAEDKQIHLWNEEATTLHILKGHEGPVRACAFSPDGLSLASASLDKTCKVWELSSKTVKHSYEHRGKVYDVSFFGDGTRIITASAFATCTIWSTEQEDRDGMVREFKTGSGSCFSCSLMLQDSLMCMASEGGQLLLWSVEEESSTPALSISAHAGTVFRTSTSKDGAWLVSSSADKITKLWNINAIASQIAQEQEKHAPAAPEDEQELDLLQDEDEAENSESLVNGKQVKEHPVWVQSIALSPSGTYGVSSSEDGKLWLWDTDKAEMIMRCECAHVCRVASFPPHTDDLFVAACDDGVIRVYKIPEMLSSGSGACSSEMGYHDLCIRTLKFSRDGSRFITGALDHLAKIWSLGSISQEMSLQGHQGSVLDAEVSPSMSLYVTSSTDKTIRVWNAKSGKEQWQGKHGAYVYACGFSPDNKRAISVSGDRTVRVWTAKKGECLHILKAKSALLTCAISEAGFLLCAGFEGAMHMWDLKAYEAPPLDLVGHDAEIRSLRLSRFGSYALSASNDGSVRIFDCRSGQPLGALPWPFAFTAMSAVVDQERAICMCGDAEGNVLIVRIHGVHDTFHRHISHGDSLASKK